MFDHRSGFSFLRRVVASRCPSGWWCFVLFPGIWFLSYVVFVLSSKSAPLSAGRFLAGVGLACMTFGYFMAETCYRNIVGLFGVNFFHWDSLFPMLPFWGVWLLSAVLLHVACVTKRYWALYLALALLLSFSTLRLVFQSIND